MAFTNKMLAAGGLTTSVATLYTQPVGTTAVILGVWNLTNKNTTTARVVTLRMGASGSTRVVISKSLAALESFVWQVPLTLSTVGHIVEGQQDVGTDVDYVLSGVEVS